MRAQVQTASRDYLVVYGMLSSVRQGRSESRMRPEVSRTSTGKGYFMWKIDDGPLGEVCSPRLIAVPGGSEYIYEASTG